jgi:acetyl esterase/lipase
MMISRFAVRFFLSVFLLPGLVFPGLSCRNNEPLEPEPLTYTKVTRAYSSITGVDPNLLSLDIYHFGETATRRPVVVYIHGGAFALGDKANQMENKTRLFSTQGYLLAGINYRLSPSTAGSESGRVQFPVHHNDAADAVAWIRTNISSYGGDPGRIALLGHSAGAQIAALLGVSAAFLPERNFPLSALSGVACFDTEGYDVGAQARDNNAVYLNAFGTREADWISGSPLLQVQSGVALPRFFIAKRGSATRIGYANAFIAALSTAGATVEHITASQYDHEGINDAIGAPGETAVTGPLIAFLERCFEK